MRNFEDFAGCFGDFQTMFLDTDFDSYVLRFYDENGEAYFKNVIGYTELNGDILLHMVDCEGIDTYDELLEATERQGVSFQLLSKMLGEDGFDIFPCDQLGADDDDDDDECQLHIGDLCVMNLDDSDCPYEHCETDCTNCGDCETDDTWTCHCGNVNDGLFCLKCDCFEDMMDEDCEFKALVEFGEVLREVGERFAADLEIAGVPQELFMTSPNPAEINGLFRELTGVMKGLLEEE